MTSTVPGPLRIGLLGPFYVYVGGQEIKPEVWTSKKALSLLKYLAARHGQRVSSDALMDLLWPDSGDGDSTRLLHTAVWFVRNKIGPENTLAESPLHYSDGSYWLELCDDCLDTSLFENHVKGSRKLEKGNPQLALAHCLEALQLYRDDFLCDDLYEEWTTPYRDEYQELFFEISQRAAHLLLKFRNDYKGALRICRQAIRKDPFREEIYQAGIEALILDQRYPEAMNLYRQYCQMLKEEFQLEPSQTIQDLVNDIKHGTGKSAMIDTANTETTRGAFPCDRTILQSMFASEVRRLERTQSNFSILIVSCEGRDQNDSKSRMIFDILQQSLRHSDMICQYAPDKIVAFLPDTNAQGSRMLLRRMEQLIATEVGNSSGITFEILNSENLQYMQERWKTRLA